LALNLARLGSFGKTEINDCIKEQEKELKK